jgi:hypothetical protein
VYNVGVGKAEAFVLRGSVQDETAVVPLFFPNGAPECDDCQARQNLLSERFQLKCSGVIGDTAQISTPPLKLRDANIVVSLFNCTVNPNNLAKKSHS